MCSYTDNRLALDLQLKYKVPDFDHPRLYAALKTLFGESTTAALGQLHVILGAILLKINKL